jgi:hypothetical protein
MDPIELQVKPGETVTIQVVGLPADPLPDPDPPVDPEPEDDDLEFLEPQPSATVLPKSTVRLRVPAATEKVNINARLRPSDPWTPIETLSSAPWTGTVDLSGFPGTIELQATARAGRAQIDRVIIPVTVSEIVEPEPPVEPDPPLPEAGTACGVPWHTRLHGRWHPAIDPVTGCLFEHEHGDNPDESGEFAARGIPPVDLDDLLELEYEHLRLRGKTPADMPFHTQQYKVQVVGKGTPYESFHQFINVNDNRLIAWAQPPLVKDRNPDWEWASYIPIRCVLLGPNGTYIDVRFVMGIAGVHARSSAVTPFDKHAFVDRHKRNPKQAAEELRSGNRGIAFYMVSTFDSDKKRQHPFVSIGGKPFFSYVFTYRNMDSTAIESGSMEEKLAGTPWHNSTLRWTSRMAMGALCEPGVYWTDIYGQKLLGTGPERPNTSEYAVKQHIGFTSGVRDFIHEDDPSKALDQPTRVTLYDEPGVSWPN